MENKFQIFKRGKLSADIDISMKYIFAMQKYITDNFVKSENDIFHPDCIKAVNLWNNAMDSIHELNSFCKARELRNIELLMDDIFGG